MPASCMLVPLSVSGNGSLRSSVGMRYEISGFSPVMRRGGRLCPSAENSGFSEIYGEFATFSGRQSRRPLQRLLLSPVGADDSVRPQTAPVFTGIYGESVAAQRADVGIGPYGTPANPYFPASFERKVFLQQILNRSYSQIWCTITGGAYQIARRVSTCVRNICKSDSCLNRTAECTPRPQAPLFSPFFSGKAEKKGPSETYPAHNLAKHLNHQEGTTRENSLFS